jgi:hypothetical protein
VAAPTAANRERDRLAREREREALQLARFRAQMQQEPTRYSEWGDRPGDIVIKYRH